MLTHCSLSNAITIGCSFTKIPRWQQYLLSIAINWQDKTSCWLTTRFIIFNFVFSHQFAPFFMVHLDNLLVIALRACGRVTLDTWTRKMNNRLRYHLCLHSYIIKIKLKKKSRTTTSKIKQNKETIKRLPDEKQIGQPRHRILVQNLKYVFKLSIHWMACILYTRWCAYELLIVVCICDVMRWINRSHKQEKNKKKQQHESESK